jgi:hypothetical protein
MTKSEYQMYPINKTNNVNSNSSLFRLMEKKQISNKTYHTNFFRAVARELMGVRRMGFCPNQR